MFFTSKYVNERDIKGDENKINQFLRDISYKQRGDTKNNRSKLKRRLLASIGDPLHRLHNQLCFPLAKMKYTDVILVIISKGL